MKIDALNGQDAGSYNNRTEKAETGAKQKEAFAQQIKRGTLFAGDLNLLQNSVAERKQKAQKDALEAVMKQYSMDQEIEQILKEHADNRSKWQESAKVQLGEINEIEAQKQKMKEEWGITDDSEEQQNLELLEKERDSQICGSEIVLTKEEKERLKNMGELTEYQQASLSLDETKSELQKTLKDSQKMIELENNAINSLKKVLLKSQPMVHAQKEKNLILKEASDEMVGMIVEDAKDKIESDQEKQEEEAEEVQQKKEDLEAKRTEKNEETEKKMEQIEEDYEKQKNGKNLDYEISKIRETLKLLMEDIKGSVVDEVL